VVAIDIGASPRNARQDAGNDENDESDGRGHGPSVEGKQIEGKARGVMSGPMIGHGLLPLNDWSAE
jgi:hypothetical protein